MTQHIIQKIQAGLIGGFVGGIVFGIILAFLGIMPTIAALIDSDSAVVGFILHMVISLFIGLLYAWWFGNSTVTAGSGIALGMLHGIIWWIAGALTIMPLLLGNPVQYTNLFSSGNMLSLLGHVIYGIILGVLYYALRYQSLDTPPRVKGRHAMQH